MNRAEAIADTVELWLADEILDADTGHNAILSEFIERKADLQKPYDDDTNFCAAKARSHYNRLGIMAEDWARLGAEGNDVAGSKYLFLGLMMISGNYRQQRLIEAKSADEYLEKRYARPIGINIGAEVKRGLVVHEPVLGLASDERLSAGIELVRRSNELNMLTHRGFYNRPEQLAHAGDDYASELFVNMQKLWVVTTAIQVVIAASFRDGDFSRVAFPQPRSITYQNGVDYPLAQS